MMSSVLFLSVNPFETRVALTENSRLVSYRAERHRASSVVGNIRVCRIRLGIFGVVGHKDIGEVIEDAAGLANIQKSVAVEANIDKRRLHAGQDPIDPPLVDISDHR